MNPYSDEGRPLCGPLRVKIGIIVNARYREEEIEARRRYFESKVSSGTQIELLFPDAAPLPTETPPTSEELTALAVDIVRKAKEAEARRFDAAVVYITYDVGVDAAMSMVRIPVIGSGRVAYHTASLLGNKICVIAPYDSLIPLSYRAAQTFGFDHMITPIRALNIPVGRMREQKEKARARVIELAKQGIHEGAQVIFPQGLNSVSIHLPLKEVEVEIGCPIIDAVPLALRFAETFVSLGLTHSRLAYPLPS